MPTSVPSQAPGSDAASLDASPVDSHIAPRRQRNLLAIVERQGLLGVLVAVIILFTVWVGDVFFTWDNLHAVAASQVVVGIIALSLILPLAAGEFDLSVGAVAGLCAFGLVTAGGDFGLPLLPAVVVAIAMGALIGLTNGLLVTGVGVNSIIATLGVATIVGGLVTWRSDGKTITTGVSDTLIELGTGKILGIPIAVVVLAAAALLVWYVLQHTPFGRELVAVGANADAARLVGIRVERRIVMAFAASGALAGLAGVMQVARAATADPQSGPTYLIPALAAAFLGATAVRPGQFNVGGTMIAVFLFAACVSGLSLAGVPAFVEALFTGATLVVGVAVSAVIARRRGTA